MVKTFTAEICFIANYKDEEEARQRLNSMLNNPRFDLISVSVDNVTDVSDPDEDIESDGFPNMEQLPDVTMLPGGSIEE